MPRRGLRTPTSISSWFALCGRVTMVVLRGYVEESVVRSARSAAWPSAGWWRPVWRQSSPLAIPSLPLIPPPEEGPLILERLPITRMPAQFGQRHVLNALTGLGAVA